MKKITKEKLAKLIAKTIDLVQESVGVQQEHELEAIVLEILRTHEIV